MKAGFQHISKASKGFNCFGCDAGSVHKVRQVESGNQAETRKVTCCIPMKNESISIRVTVNARGHEVNKFPYHDVSQQFL